MTIALVGDSHAQQWFPAFDRAARELHWRLWVWTKTACPLIDLTVRLPQFHQTYPWCDGWRDALISRLRSLPRLDAVVVAHYSATAVDPRRFAAPPAYATTSDPVSTWESAWARTETALEPVTRHIVILADNPKPAVDVPACLAAHPGDDRSCSFPHPGAASAGERIAAAERAVAVPGSTFLGFTDVLCPAARCPVVWQDGTIVYRDDHHLTATMAEKLGAVVAQRLSRAISSSAAHP